MADRESIERRFANDKEAAEAFREANPERYAELINEAANRRSDAYSTLAEERETEARTATLSQARSAATQKYPLADPNAIIGDTAETIEASAKRSHDFVAKVQEDARKEALAARRPETRQAWTGSPTGARPGIPGGELRQPESANKELVERTYSRTAEILSEARKPGTLRRYSDDAMSVLRDADPEAQAFADYRALHPNSGLSDAALRARAEGTASFVTAPSGAPDAEDKRG